MTDSLWCVLDGDDLIVARIRGIETALVVTTPDMVDTLVSLAQAVSSSLGKPLQVREFSYSRVHSEITPEPGV